MDTSTTTDTTATDTSSKGLSSSEAEKLLQQYGLNALEEKSLTFEKTVALIKPVL